MTNVRPNLDPQGLYNVTEAARALQVDRHTVRRYETQGLISFRVRKAGRSKVTSGRQIIKCWETMYF